MLIVLRKKYVKIMKAYIFSDGSLLRVLIGPSVGGNAIFQAGHGLEFGTLKQIIFI
jgi:hypothetical protein